MDTPANSEICVVQGIEIPALGFGTARMAPAECRRAVETALEEGYRHIDTAQMYDTEAAVGEALMNSVVARENVFLVTKLDTGNVTFDAVLESTRQSLDRLRTDSVDLLLIHAPSDDVPVSETLEAMNELQEDGRVDHIGVSNFSVTQLREAMESSRTPIVTNQVEYHPYQHQEDLLQFCIDEEILLTAYSPLARGEVFEDDQLQTIGERYGKSAGQIALRWQVQQPFVAAIPKASSREHIEANADIFDFELTRDEMKQIFEIGGGISEQLAQAMSLD